MIRVLIIDDHSALAGALAFTIDGYPDLRCVGTAGTLAEARTMVDQLRPDVVLLDVQLPDGNGIESIPSIVAANPGMRVLVLTGHTDVDQLSRAASHGASGFLPKESSIAAVINLPVITSPSSAPPLSIIRAMRSDPKSRIRSSSNERKKSETPGSP